MWQENTGLLGLLVEYSLNRSELFFHRWIHFFKLKNLKLSVLRKLRAPFKHGELTCLFYKLLFKGGENASLVRFLMVSAVSFAALYVEIQWTLSFSTTDRRHKHDWRQHRNCIRENLRNHNGLRNIRDRWRLGETWKWSLLKRIKWKCIE